MTYESTISFTLDTICPWTYLAKRRLDHALSQYREANPSSPCTFKVKFMPYQLYPEASQEGEDKFAWYKKSRYGDSEEKMRMYTTLMSAYGVACGINFKFGGVVANTLNAHRVIQCFQERRGLATADMIVDSLYKQYFEEEKHPSSHETLMKACTDAGIGEDEARQVLEDESEGLMDVKMLIREQAGNGIDSVPHIVFEGRKRDLTLEGAKDVNEYMKVLEIIAKESA
ncbi:uncharacterized protein PV09_05356 [Verruconis gallopava]|uniref:DSBA-like thioredoxin domain-containing protein n=1 Tax=Verruconis gallopava TaxID=253628 RepID=A0A0D2AA35_9PEZI|nr:uncharacterized protein PV09_05356 [Verruconis gallopava]KIW03603.1 hypothetical protein PV09_05356 [Verruconis gallopava]